MAILQNVQQDGNYLGCRKSKKRYFFEIRANKKAPSKRWGENTI